MKNILLAFKGNSRLCCSRNLCFRYNFIIIYYFWAVKQIIVCVHIQLGTSQRKKMRAWGAASLHQRLCRDFLFNYFTSSSISLGMSLDLAKDQIIFLSLCIEIADTENGNFASIPMSYKVTSSYEDGFVIFFRKEFVNVTHRSKSICIQSLCCNERW